MQLRRDVDLGARNTLALPSVAEQYVRALVEADVEEAARYARDAGRGLFVLGGGSNVLLSPRIEALVLQPALAGIDVEQGPGAEVVVRVGAGEDWHGLVTELLSRGCHGLENLALIPGLAGAAPVQNIGAYGVELDRFIESVRAFDLRTLSWVELGAAQCEFRYRSSIFRGASSGRYVIGAVTLRLSREPSVDARYAALQQELDRRGVAQPTPADVFQAVVAVRRSKLPDPASLPNAGSFFKNPVVPGAQGRELQHRFPGLVVYPQASGACKLAAGWLIEQAGFKGRVIGGVGMHASQALVLVNHGGADCATVLDYAERVRAAVRDRFGVTLEREPLWVQVDGHCA